MLNKGGEHKINSACDQETKNFPSDSQRKLGEWVEETCSKLQVVVSETNSMCIDEVI